MGDLIFIITAQIFIASIKYDVLALLGLNVDIRAIYISHKSSENALARMAPCLQKQTFVENVCFI